MLGDPRLMDCFRFTHYISAGSGWLFQNVLFAARMGKPIKP